MPKSISSNLMTKVTLDRNENMFISCAKYVKWSIFSEIRYISITAIAIIETVATAVFLGLSLFFLPFTKTPTKDLYERLKSSSFSIIWGGFDVIFNLSPGDLIADEESVRKAVRAPCRYPKGSLLEVPAYDEKNYKYYKKKIEKIDNYYCSKEYKEKNLKNLLKDYKKLSEDSQVNIITFLPNKDIIFNIRAINKSFQDFVEGESFKNGSPNHLRKLLIKNLGIKKVQPDKFSDYTKLVFKKDPYIRALLFREAKTTINSSGKRKISFSDKNSIGLKKFLRIFSKIKKEEIEQKKEFLEQVEDLLKDKNISIKDLDNTKYKNIKAYMNIYEMNFKKKEFDRMKYYHNKIIKKKDRKECLKEVNFLRVIKLYMDSQKLLKKASFINKIRNFFRDIFSDSAELPKIIFNLIFLQDQLKILKEHQRSKVADLYEMLIKKRNQKKIDTIS